MHLPVARAHRAVLAALAFGVAPLCGTTALAQAAAKPAAASVKDLPLEEVEATGSTPYFAIFFTGDGNFAELDKGVSGELTSRGIPVVAFNQRSYLYNGKTPDQTGADLARIMAWYREHWKRDTVVVIGYSRGAGTAPFAVNRLPPAQRGAVKAVALIGPEMTAGFKFRWRDLLSNKPAPDELPMMPELQRLGLPALCVFGSAERDTPCREVSAPWVPIKIIGDHYFDDEYQTIGRRIARFVLTDLARK